jgi:hypothetical protein
MLSDSVLSLRLTIKHAKKPTCLAKAEDRQVFFTVCSRTLKNFSEIKSLESWYTGNVVADSNSGEYYTEVIFRLFASLSGK